MNVRTRALAAGAVASAVALGSLGFGAAAASALNPGNFVTGGTFWHMYAEEPGVINDAGSFFPDDNAFGDTGDAFDGIGYVTWENAAAEGTEGQLVLVPVSSSRGSDSEEFVYSGTDSTAANTIQLTLTLEGNFARWAYTVTGPDVADISLTFGGDAGSDSDTASTVDGATATVNDGGNGDSAFGLSAASDGLLTDWLFDSDAFEITATGASSFEVSTLLAHYNPCGFDDAVTFVAQNVGSMAAVFGTSYPEFGQCFSAASTTTQVGQAVDMMIPLASHSSIYTGPPEGETGDEVPLYRFFPDEAVPPTSSPEPSPSPSPDPDADKVFIRTAFGLPAGLTGVPVWDAVDGLRLHVTGTPTTPGTFTASIEIGALADSGEDYGYKTLLPGSAPFVVSAAAAPAVAPAPSKPQLAESGVDTSGLILAGMLALMIGGGVFVGARRLTTARD